MQNLKNKLGQWIPVLVLLICGLIAAGSISSTQARLAKEINNKFDTKVYDRDQAHRLREFDRFQKQLDRIEEKLDAINNQLKVNPGNGGDS